MGKHGILSVLCTISIIIITISTLSLFPLTTSANSCTPSNPSNTHNNIITDDICIFTPLSYNNMTIQQDNNSPDPTVPPGYLLEPDPTVYTKLEFTNPARIRESMIKSSWDCPGGLCSAGFEFVHSFPRIGGSNGTFPEDLLNLSFGKDSATYAIGVFSLTAGIPLVILIIFCIACSCFACWRCCCNMCGGRIATKKYSTKRQWIHRIVMIIWAVLLLVCLFLCIAANHGISRGINESVDGVDSALGFIDTTVNIVATVTNPFSARTATLNTVADAFDALPANAKESKDCYGVEYIPSNIKTGEEGYEPSTVSPDADGPNPCLILNENTGGYTSITCDEDPFCCDNQLPADQAYYNTIEMCINLSSSPNWSPPLLDQRCNPCNASSSYWRRWYNPSHPLCNACDPNGVNYYPYAKSCSPCNPSSPSYNPTDPYCLPPSDPSSPCATNPTGHVQCDPCNRASVYAYVQWDIFQCTAPSACEINPTQREGYCNPCLINSVHYNEADCALIQGEPIDECDNVTSGVGDSTLCDICNPNDIHFNVGSPHCPWYWATPSSRLPNEQKIISHLDLSNDINTSTDNLIAITEFPLVADVTTVLGPAYHRLREVLEPYYSDRGSFNAPIARSDWNQRSNSVSTQLKSISSWPTSMNNVGNGLNAQTTQEYFNLNADFYTTLHNTTALVKSTLIPGTSQLSSLQGAPETISTISAPLYDKDFTGIISALESGVVSSSQCTAMRTDIGAFVEQMLDLIDLNRASLNNSIIAELERYETVYQENDLASKWAYIVTQSNRIPTLATTLSSQWDGFIGQQLMTQLSNLNYATLEQAQSEINALTGILQAITSISSSSSSNALDVSQRTTQYSNLDTKIQSDTTTSPLTWGSHATRISSAAFTNGCMADLATELQVGNEWITELPDDIQFIVQHQPMFNALWTDISSSATNGSRVQAVVDALHAAISGISSALVSTNAELAKDHVQNGATVFNSAYTSQNARNRLINLSTPLDTIIKSLKSPNMSLITSLHRSSNSQVTNALNRLINSGSMGILTQFNQLSIAFSNLGQIATRYTPAATLLLDLAHKQIIAQMQAIYNELGACTTTIVFSEGKTPVGLIDNLKIIQSFLNDNNIPSKSSTSQEVSAYNLASETLTSYNTEIQPVLDTIHGAFAPYSSFIASNDWTTVPYSNIPRAPSYTSQYENFINSLITIGSLQSDVVNILDTNNPIPPVTIQFGTLMRNFDQFIKHADAINIVKNKKTSIYDPSYHTIDFPYSPFVSKPEPYLYTDFTKDPPVVGTKTTLYAIIEALVKIRSEVVDDVRSTADSIDSRVAEIQQSIADLSVTIDTWGDYRTDIKRDGYLADQARLIIVDVFIVIGIVIVFTVAITALFKFHKMVMVCTTLLYPFIFIALLFSMVHMAPSLVVADGCDQQHDIIRIVVGDSNISSSYTAGLISYISTEPAQDMPVMDVVKYISDCPPEQEPPQIWRVLRDTTSESIANNGDDLTTVRSTVEQYLDPLGIKPSGKLDDAVTHMTTISVDLAERANVLYDTIQCSKTKPVYDATVNDGLCDGVARSAALLGAMFLLTSLCMMPFLICGCSAFKVLNRRNHEKYTKKYIKKDTDGGTVVYAHGYVEGSEEKGEILHFKTDEPVQLEDGIKYSDLKGFDGLKNHPTHKDLEMSQF